MNSRQEIILGSTVREYVDLAAPVSSSLLAGKYNLSISSATIRSEMLKLEKEGYLYQPHTSAGRIPTDKGFRYFVDVLMEEKEELSLKEKRSLRARVSKLKLCSRELTKTTAKLLSSMSNNLAVSGIIDSEDFCRSGVQRLLSQPEFDNLDSICKIAEVIDYLDENIDKLSKEFMGKSEVEIFIGRENPVIKSDECSMVVSNYKLKSGERGILAIIGPKRMRYSHNVSLIGYLKKLLSNEEY